MPRPQPANKQESEPMALGCTLRTARTVYKQESEPMALGCTLRTARTVWLSAE